jgi:hypothetical protein
VTDGAKLYPPDQKVASFRIENGNQHHSLHDLAENYAQAAAGRSHELPFESQELAVFF